MNNFCLVASYGGSGSTFLTHALAKSSKSYKFLHTHAVPDNRSIGFPVFNKYTGHSEGPFSKFFPLPEGSKVIVIYRNPAEAYRSRCSLKHYCHLWSGTQKFAQDLGEEFVFDSKECRARFNKIWAAYKGEGKDVLDLKLYMDKWRAFSESPSHNVLFVKYEKLGELAEPIGEFLDIKSLDLSGFNAKTRVVEDEVAAMFSYSSEWAKLPSFEVFNSGVQIDNKSLCGKLRVCLTEDELLSKAFAEIREKVSTAFPELEITVTEHRSDNEYKDISLYEFCYQLLFDPLGLMESFNLRIIEIGQHKVNYLAYLDKVLASQAE